MIMNQSLRSINTSNSFQGRSYAEARMHVLPHRFGKKKKKKKKGRRQSKKERKDVLAYPVDLHERGD